MEISAHECNVQLTHPWGHQIMTQKMSDNILQFCTEQVIVPFDPSSIIEEAKKYSKKELKSVRTKATKYY